MRYVFGTKVREANLERAKAARGRGCSSSRGARSATKQSPPRGRAQVRLLRGACHRAGQRPDPLARNDAFLASRAMTAAIACARKLLIYANTVAQRGTP